MVDYSLTSGCPLQSSSLDLSSLKLVSGNSQKVKDIKLATGYEPEWVQFEPDELQASKEFDSLRLQGEGNYALIAQRSALQKFHLMVDRLGKEVAPGYTVVDSTLWAPWFNGLPGLNAAQIFASTEMSDGSFLRSDAMLQVFCERSRKSMDRRVVWIETAVTAELDESRALLPRIRQAVGLCFVTDAPYASGNGMWPITCPHPIRLAALRGNSEAVEDLSAISDTKWELPKKAQELGLLVSFSELSDRSVVVKSSPRGDLFVNWQREGSIE
jgi:hypothetical protein